MRLKLTLDRGAGADAADVLINIDAAASVGTLADYLAAADPRGPSAEGHSTLRRVDAGAPNIDRRTRIADSGIRSGDTVSLVGIDEDRRSAVPTQVAAVMVVRAGPDEGREFPLSAGASLIGRDSSCEVRLSDAMVSRRHARVNVGELVEIVDMGSSNGLLVGDDAAERVVLRPGDSVQIGETVLAVRMLQASGGTSNPTSVVFNRPPRIDRRFDGEELSAPEPPDRPQAQRFPILPLFAPLVLGLVLYLSTKALASLIFVAMSPLLIVANALEGRMAGRKAYAAALRQFRLDIATLVEEADQLRTEEKTRRLAEHPSCEEVVAAVTGLTPLMWSRWPDLPGFCDLRLGTGLQASRNRVHLPTGRQNNRGLWKELRDAVEPYSSVDDVPVVASLSESGSVGLGGSRDQVLGVARAMVMQLVGLHSPAEMVLVGLASSQTAPAWEWVKWLPHCATGTGPFVGSPLAATDSACAGLLAELSQLVDDRQVQAADNRTAETLLPHVIVLIEDDAPVARSSAADLAMRGGPLGVHVIWVAADVTRLPAACRVFVDIAVAPAGSTVGFMNDGVGVSPIAVESLSEAVAVSAARRLSPVIDAVAGSDSQSGLARSISLLTLSGAEVASSPQAVIERWTESRSVLTGPYATTVGGRSRPGTLRAVVGEGATGPHILDLRAQGPHALVGGTTGSGKSELLQSWILGMALHNSPQRVTFLLVDYKGGSAFAECRHLPHTVGLVTDLSPHLVRRALTSLSAELTFRERLLHRKGAKDLLDLERSGDPETPPSLVIVVDEFAALVQEVPDFVDGVVNVAQRGRSLGLHLILATQRPAGVIKDNLRANTNLRLALRMADEADSADVIGTTDAAAFDPSIPGRAVSRTGPSRLVSFQSAYAGGWTTDRPPVPDIEVTTFGFGARTVWERPAVTDAEGDEPGRTDIQRVVANIRAARTVADLPDPRLPWLDELAEVYDLARLPTSRRDDDLVFGVADDPEHQSQPTVSFRPDDDGNLAVYGTGNSGKSTLLRTLAVAAGFTVRGGPCHVYGIDFGARGLSMLESLPHVGSIIAGSDNERIVRLLAHLRATIDERAVRYSNVGAGTITAYRRISGDKEEARILLLVDGMGAFRTAYEGTEHARTFEQFLAIAADGRQVGVHVVLSADRPGALPIALGAQVQRRVVLRLADPNDYATFGLPSDVLDQKSPAGRGLLNEREIQVAVLGDSRETAVQAVEMEKFSRSMAAAGTVSAPAIERLPDRLWLADLPKDIDGLPVLGLSSATLAPVGFEPSGTFTVAGAPGSGRTTALTAVVTALQRWRPDTNLIYIGNRRSPLAAAFEWRKVALGPNEAAELAPTVGPLIGELVGDVPPWVIVIEGLPDFVNGPADYPLTEMAQAVVASGHLLVTDGDPAALSGGYQLLSTARSGRTGIVLQPEQSDSSLLRTQFPRLRRSEFPVGRGFLVPRGGQPVVVQVGMP